MFRNIFADQWFYSAAVIFLLAGSVFAFVVGLGLMLRSAAMFRFFALMNRWVSTREMMKSAERPRDIDTILHRQTELLGGVIVVCAGLSLWLLLRNFDVDGIAGALRNRAAPLLVELTARVAKWTLVIGHVMAIAVGIALIFQPAAIAKLESRANHWFSLRAQGRDLDLMHLTLDQWVQSYPRAVGFCIVALALFVVVSLGGTFLSRL